MDRSRAAGLRLREISRTLARRGGERKAQVLQLTGKAGKLLERSIREARSLAKELRAKARGRGAKAKLAAAERLEELAARCEKVAVQVRKRVKGEPLSDRIISLSDTDARPIRKGGRGKPTEFGYVSQVAEVTAATKPGQRGFVPPSTAPGNPHENELLPQTVAELQAVGMSPQEVSLDGGFGHRKTDEQLAPIAPERTFIAGRPSDRSKRTQRRLARYRVGAEVTDIAPQARLRPRPIPPQRKRRPPDLDRMGGPRLQPRHLRRAGLSERAPRKRTAGPAAKRDDRDRPPARCRSHQPQPFKFFRGE